MSTIYVGKVTFENSQYFLIIKKRSSHQYDLTNLLKSASFILKWQTRKDKGKSGQIVIIAREDKEWHQKTNDGEQRGKVRQYSQRKATAKVICNHNAYRYNFTFNYLTNRIILFQCHNLKSCTKIHVTYSFLQFRY